MSGHSKWATIKRKKGAADAARGKLFNRIIKEITVAARLGGGDREANPRLRSAIAAAKASNMPNKNIDTAIAKGTGQLEGATYEEITFEGYGPAGVAVLVESVTDNRNRTVAEVRHVLTKAGGNLGSTNSVKWMFSTRGEIRIPFSAMDEESLMEVALEAGADDFVKENEEYLITTSFESFDAVRSSLEKLGIHPSSAAITKVPENTVTVQGDTAHKVLKLMEALDELDDTQNVYANFDISDVDMDSYGN